MVSIIQDLVGIVQGKSAAQPADGSNVFYNILYRGEPHPNLIAVDVTSSHLQDSITGKILVFSLTGNQARSNSITVEEADVQRLFSRLGIANKEKMNGHPFKAYYDGVKIIYVELQAAASNKPK